MSSYTTELRFICETAAGLEESTGYKSVDSIIEKAIPYVFDFDFPIFDENYRKTLCKKILKHYYTREICEETVGLWKLRLATKMNEIMPYYNKLYESELLEFNPLENTNVQTEHHGTNTGNGIRRNLYSETPQGALTNVEDETYLTNASKDISEGSGSDDYTTSVKGKTGGESSSKLLKDYRSTFINIDLMIIAELNVLFFGLW